MDKDPKNISGHDSPADSGSSVADPHAQVLAAQEKRSLDRWARVQRSEQLFTRLLMLLVIVLTIAAGMLDVWRQSHIRLLPYTLEAWHNLDAGEKALFSAEMDWQSPQSPNITRPELVMQGKGTLPLAGKGKALSVALEERVPVTIHIPRGVTPGRHQGNLRLSRVSGPADLPAYLDIPVVIGVSSSLWDNWHTLTLWIIILTVCYVLLYLASLLLTPLPKGMLLVTVDFPDRPRTCSVLLKPRLSSWFFPWRRHVFPLQRLLKRTRASERVKLHGELYFPVTGASPVVSIRTRGSFSVFRTPQTMEQAPFINQSAIPVAGQGQMFEDFNFHVADRERCVLVELRYFRSLIQPSGGDHAA